MRLRADVAAYGSLQHQAWVHHLEPSAFYLVIEGLAGP